MPESPTQNNEISGNHPFFILAEKISAEANSLLKDFNSREIHLKSLMPHQRIFLFFLTRAIKTFSAIRLLCQKGYGQDIATLLRGLLENLISVKYILSDPQSADQKAARFVEYKWIIFKRYLPEEKEDPRQITDALRQELITKKTLIIDKIKEFKEKYKITSDRALITWSGRSVRDMARMINREWLEEYDSTFRLSSRFSHPSIIGDQEYMNHQDHNLIFYPFPSMIGVLHNLQIAIKYLFEYLLIMDSFFDLKRQDKLRLLRQEINTVIQSVENERKVDDPHHATAGLQLNKSEDIIIKFQQPTQ